MEHKIIILQKFAQDLQEEEDNFKQYLPENLTDKQREVLSSYSSINKRDITRAKVAIKKLQQQLRVKHNKQKAIKILIKKKKERALAILAKKRQLQQETAMKKW